MTTPEKPPYRVESMDQIRALPWNGRTVVSTFSGCGGSCLGFRMAGYRIVWANEFVEAARDSYLANASPSTILSGDDIRTVSAASILEATGLAVGEVDVLEGSPPCASFSTAGSREKGWGQKRAYSDTAQRADDLFFEYTRLLRELQPKTFVAENVSGLVKGTAKGYFKMILAEMRDCGYQVAAQLLDAQWLGVPQGRKRIIFMGVRNDLADQYGVAPSYPTPFPYRYSVRDALPEILSVKHGGTPDNWQSADRPAPTIVGSGATLSETAYLSGGTYVEARAVHDTSGTWGLGDITDRPSPTITVGVNSVNSNHFQIERAAVTHDQGEDITLDRYALGPEWDKLAPGEQSERFFSLKRTPIDGPSQTVTAGGGDVSKASVTHPVERRKFTIAELRRICAFPDDFALTGTYAQQWERLGRSVPPLMMKAVAQSLHDGVFEVINGHE